MVYRGLNTYTPDVWLRYARKQLTLEFEGVATIGSIANVSDVELPRYPNDPLDPEGLDPAVEESVSILRFGAVGRLNYSGRATVRLRQPVLRGFSYDLQVPRIEILKAEVGIQHQRN